MLRLSSTFAIVQEGKWLYAVHRKCGTYLNVDSKSADCMACDASFVPPKAAWCPKDSGSRVSGSLPLSVSDTIRRGWVASWLGVPMDEVTVEVDE